MPQSTAETLLLPSESSLTSHHFALHLPSPLTPPSHLLASGALHSGTKEKGYKKPSPAKKANLLLVLLEAGASAGFLPSFCHHTSPWSPSHQTRAVHLPSLPGIMTLPLTSLRLSPVTHAACSHPPGKSADAGQGPTHLILRGLKSVFTTGSALASRHAVC